MQTSTAARSLLTACTSGSKVVRAERWTSRVPHGGLTSCTRPQYARPGPTSFCQIRHGFNVSTPEANDPVQGDSPRIVPYSDITIGAAAEQDPYENRFAMTPANAALLLRKGFRQVLIPRDGGARAGFPDASYTAAGATMCSSEEVLSQSDIVVKVRPPRIGTGTSDEPAGLRKDGTLISFVQPTQNPELLSTLAGKGTTALAMEMIPRISRAQSFDALSSMANIAGYKAVLEAANAFSSMMTGQTTAAGKVPPTKVLVIGAGVAGLSAIATARRMGAIVRGFDTRAAALEQIKSLGGEPLEVKVAETGEGGGGYAKVMSKEEAEMKLFHAQCREVYIVITTALIPNKPAPILITNEMLADMKPGSVIVDLAAETGGNCEATVKGEVFTTAKGVKIIGYTDLPSRLPTQASTLYSNNITKFLLSLSPCTLR